MCSLKIYLFLFCVLKFVQSNKNVTEKIPDVGGDGEANMKDMQFNTTKRILMFMDESVSPCENFYKYACGNFERLYPLSEEQSEISIDSILEKQLTASTQKFLELPLEDTLNLRDLETKARLFYRDCVDIDTRRRRGSEPMIQFIKSLGGWHIFNQTWDESNFDVMELLGKLSHYNTQIILQITIQRYTIMTGEHYLIIWEGRGRTFPANEILYNPSEVERYENFVREVLLLAGATPDVINETTSDVVNFEVELTKLINAPKNISNSPGIITLEEIQSAIPKIDWGKLLRVAFKRRIHPKQKVELLNYQYFNELQNLLTKSSIKTLANYIFWKTLVDFGGMLDERIKDARKRYTNEGKATSIKKYCVDLTTYTMPDAAHLHWIKDRDYSKSVNKKEVTELAEMIRRSFVRGIEENPWLDVRTKKKLLERIETMVFEVGCPNEKCLKSIVNRKFQSLTIIPNKFFESALNAIKRRRSVQMGRLNMKAKFPWFICGKSLNAFYIRNQNKIVVPTGLLNPPFYSPTFPAALNFGIMGWLLAHEITHGFDNSGLCNGCNVDDRKNWSNESATEFDRLAECFVEQFNSYKIYNMSIKGITTQKENIADTTGLRFAYKSYLNWLEVNPSEKVVHLQRSDISNKQLFFLSFAHLWCSAASKKSIKVTIRLDKHSPPEMRVFGSLSNSPEFAEVFKCPVGSTMNPEKKCNIW